MLKMANLENIFILLRLNHTLLPTLPLDFTCPYEKKFQLSEHCGPRERGRSCISTYPSQSISISVHHRRKAVYISCMEIQMWAAALWFLLVDGWWYVRLLEWPYPSFMEKRPVREWPPWNGEAALQKTLQLNGQELQLNNALCFLTLVLEQFTICCRYAYHLGVRAGLRALLHWLS